jgi:hypothetical protein
MGSRTVPAAEDLESSRILLSDAAKAAWEHRQLLDEVFNPISHRKFQLATDQQNRWTDRGSIAHRYMNVKIRTEAAQFLFGEYINWIFFAV